jgi:hypothetical protein
MDVCVLSTRSKLDNVKLGDLFCWQGTFGKNSQPKILGAIPLCLIWSIWRERNACMFEGNEC